jgi:ureidoacrylate peracid hydrolase
MSYISRTSLPEKSAAWLDRISAYNRTGLQVNPDRAGLLVIDMQNFFLDESGPAYLPAGRVVVGNVRLLIETFRTGNRPVIYTKHVHHPDQLDAGIMAWWWRDMCTEDSFESEIHPDLKPLTREKVIEKHRYSAFYNTDLETVLRCLGVEDIVITGVMTNMCCESTARDAYYRDYRVFFPADATDTVSEEMHLASLMNLAYGFTVVTQTDTLVKAF